MYFLLCKYVTMIHAGTELGIQNLFVFFVNETIYLIMYLFNYKSQLIAWNTTKIVNYKFELLIMNDFDNNNIITGVFIINVLALGTSRNNFFYFIFLLNDSHITANEHNSSHSNILYRQILNRLQYVKYENIHKEIK